MKTKTETAAKAKKAKILADDDLGQVQGGGLCNNENITTIKDKTSPNQIRNKG